MDTQALETPTSGDALPTIDSKLVEMHISFRPANTAGGGLVVVLDNIPENYPAIFFGCKGKLGHDLSQEAVEAILQSGELPLELRPNLEQDKHGRDVWVMPLPDNIYAGHYGRGANEILWPLLHGLVSYKQIKAPTFNEKSLVDYVLGNHLIALGVSSVINSLREQGHKVRVIVHDYQLMYLGGFLRNPEDEKSDNKNPDIELAYMHHVPIHEDLTYLGDEAVAAFLKQLLLYHVILLQTGADRDRLIALVQQEKLQQALNVTSTGPNHILNGHLTSIIPNIVGINPEQNSDNSNYNVKDQDFIHAVQAAKNDGRIILMAQGRADPMKGWATYYDAVAQYLENNPDMASKIALVGAHVTCRQGIPLYDESCHALESQINALRRRFPELKIIDTEKGLQHDTLPAVYAMADICIIPSVMDGCNLTVEEALLAKKDAPFAVVSTEHVGAMELYGKGCYIAPPLNVTALSEQIGRAINDSRTHSTTFIEKHQSLLAAFNTRRRWHDGVNRAFATASTSREEVPKLLAAKAGLVACYN